MIGIVLAGGSGSRLYPLTVAFSKQLLPIYDKPMIFYPLSTLMLAGIREILIVTTPRDKELFARLLGDGSDYGVTFDYFVQESPNGIAEVFQICETKIKDKKTSLVLGDNLFHGNGFGRELGKFSNVSGAHIFGYAVSDPTGYGILDVDASGRVVSVEEKPLVPKSRLAVPGLYFYDEDVLEISKNIQPSARGELEITEVNRQYLEIGKLTASVLPRGTSWFDTGSFDNLSDASNYVRILEARQGIKVSCLEEIAWNQGWISDKKLLSLAGDPKRNSLSSYLKSLLLK
jgi:glucose-1-phosphate thymidylyltransferase